jgi:hypothetical protein
MNLHDMDAPEEVIAAAERYRAAAAVVADGIAHILRELTLPRHGGSPLDRDLVTRLGWITATLGNAAAGGEVRVADTHTAVADSVHALAEADTAGARIVHRTDPYR